MATSFRFRSFRALLSTKHLRISIPIGVLVLIGLAVNPGATGLVLAYGYVLTCPLGWATASLRRRWFGPDAVAPPRTRQPSVIMPDEICRRPTDPSAGRGLGAPYWSPSGN